ncbi:MAG TPA: primosomal protein N' [Sphingobacteriaceae bacterium]|nr:primosomal protein N' [Sphingobacteriaceae bacterium]
MTTGGRMDRKTLFVDVVLPLAIQGTYTYRVPADMADQVEEGRRVIVQFGKNRIYSALIYKIGEKAPERYEAKYILDVMDEEPIVTPEQFRLWEWIADYYLCTLGEVMQAALPAVLKLASETRITKGPEAAGDRDHLHEKEFLILDALDLVPELKVSDVVKLLGQKTVFPILKRMFDKGLVLISEELAPKFRPRRQIYLELAAEFSDEEGKRLLLDSLNKAPKQQDAVLGFLQLRKQSGKITRKAIIESTGVTTQVIRSLIEKEVFVEREELVSRIGGEDVVLTKDFTLNPAQKKALQSLQQSLEEKEVTLLHGVTSSGKTQLYIRLIEDFLATGKQALYLLPEIALTTQITERLRLHFGAKLGVYHSRFNDQERAEIWAKVLKGELQLIIGARSSVFLPFHQLGLVVVDEEHETSYKQFDPAPRYHARDTAIFLGHMHGAKVVLGSATPALESFYNARSGKYGMVQLTRRFGESQFPQIDVVDLKEAARQEQMFSYFSGKLLKAMEEAISNKQQVILFQNRRGHTPVSQCKTCGYIAKCIHCDVSLTYHKSTSKLHCHYCGFMEDPLQICPACGSTHIESKGFGTERLEEELELLLPKARVGRLDLDSAKGKHGFERVLSAFDEHQYDVLIGTQMVAKGLDFGNVSVIGIINADALIHFPEFRAYERAFSLLAQVAGRAGRRDQPGQVIIQTYSPNHRVIQQVVSHDYESMFMTEINERKSFSYPPFFRMIRLEVRHKELAVAKAGAERLVFLFRQQLGERVLGPEQPLVSRIRNQYIESILLKIERQGISIAKVRELIRQTVQHFGTEKVFKSVRVLIDVDPY